MRAVLCKIGCIAVAGLMTCPAVAQDGDSGGDGSAKVMGLRFAKKPIEILTLETYTLDVPVQGYQGLDDFFNVREANPNVRAGQWEFELGMGWSTWESGNRLDDDFTLTPTLKYGYTDTFGVEIGLLPINLGDGTALSNLEGSNDGTGDISLKAFWQMVQEHDIIPGMALWADLRLPTGEGSAKMDAKLNFNATKTIADGIRAHFQAFAMTANGSRGDRDRYDHNNGNDRRRVNRDDGFVRSRAGRRDFQWGAGFGFDFAINESNMFVLNYMNRSSQYDGHGNMNMYEAGWVYNMTDTQRLQAGLDFNDTAGENEGPRWTAKVQWSFAW
jgi:hypothetical protein